MSGFKDGTEGHQERRRVSNPRHHLHAQRGNLRHHLHAQRGKLLSFLLLSLACIVLFLQPMVYATQLRGNLETFYITGEFYSAAPTTLQPTKLPTPQPTKLPTSLPPLTRTKKTVFPRVNLAKELDALQCIPQVCNASKRFISSPNFTLLASFPGSGNTWTRSMIELGTRVWTGSVYDDPELVRDGFEGERVQPYSTSRSTLSVIKTHVPVISYYVHLDGSTTSAIVILRSPFDAILSEYSRAAAEKIMVAAKRENRTVNIESTHTNKVSRENLNELYEDGFMRLFNSWLMFMNYWISKEHRANSYVNRENNVTSYEYVAGFPFKDGNTHRKIPVLVMFYEDFIRHSVTANHRLFSYLKMQMGEEMSHNALEATVCALTENREPEHTKVKREADGDGYNVYFDENHAIVRNRVVEKVCERMRDFWFPDLWGNCTNPVPQAKRLPISKTYLTKLNQVDTFC